MSTDRESRKRYHSHVTANGRKRSTKKGGLEPHMCRKCHIPIKVKALSTKLCINCSYAPMKKAYLVRF